MAVSSFVESIEYIETTIGGTSTSFSYNLTKGQDYSNCVPFMTVHSDGDYYDVKLFDMYFSGTTESGIINFRRHDQRNTAAYLKCYVVEFNPDEVRVQQGSFNLDAQTTDTVTLPTTLSGTDRAAMTFGWRTSTDNQSQYQAMVRGRVLSTTQIDFYRNNTSYNSNGHWFLFEDLGNNFRVVHKSSSFSGSGQTLTINPSDGSTLPLLRTFIQGSFATNQTSAGYLTRGTCRMFMYSNGSVRCDKQDSSYQTIYWSVQLITFLDDTKVYTPYDTLPLSLNTTNASATRNFDTGGSTRVSYLHNPDTSTIAYGCMQGIMRADSTSVSAINESFCSAKVDTTSSGVFHYYKTGASYNNYMSQLSVVDWAGIPVASGTNDNPIPEGKGQGESFVKSVENFRFYIEDYVGARALTKGQDIDNCVIFLNTRCDSGTDYIREYRAMAWFEKPNTVMLKNWDTSGQTVCDVSVVEFHPNQIKVQQKMRYTAGNQYCDTAIDEVADLNKAFIVTSTFDPGNLREARYTFVRVRFTSTTNIEMYKNMAGYEVENSIFVVEDLGENFETEHFTATWAGNWHSHYTSEAYFNDQSLVLTSFASAHTGDYPSRWGHRTYLAYPQRLNHNKGDVSYYNVYSAATVIRFLDEKYHIHNYGPNLNAQNTVTYTVSTHISKYPDAISVINANMYSVAKCNTTSEGGISELFATGRMIDDTTVEFSKNGYSYNTESRFSVVNWIGNDVREDNGWEVERTNTNSIVTSVQKYQYSGSTSAMSVYLQKGQDLNQCVPFISYSAHASDYIVLRCYHNIYRDPAVDRMFIWFGGGSTGTRNVTAYIVEFGPDIKVQYNHIGINGTSGTVTIEEVNLERAFLHFYAFSDAYDRYARPQAVCGHFVDETTIQFDRTNGDGYMFVTWYVVECPDDDTYWRVQHLYSTGKGGGSSVYATLNNFVNTDRSLFLGSYSTTHANDYPSRGYYRMYHRQDELIQFNKYDASYYNMDNMNVEVVEMSSSWRTKGFRVVSDFISLAPTATQTISLRTRTGEGFDKLRSMVVQGNQGNECRCDSTSEADLPEAFAHLEFDGDDYHTSVTATKTGGASANTYGFMYAVEWPESNAYYVEGTVVEQDLIPVSRTVRMYRADTGEQMDETVSASGTGYFRCETTYSGAHYVVCLDDEADIVYNDLIYGRIYPDVIENSFRYNEGKY